MTCCHNIARFCCFCWKESCFWNWQGNYTVFINILRNIFSSFHNYWLHRDSMFWVPPRFHVHSLPPPVTWQGVCVAYDQNSGLSLLPCGLHHLLFQVCQDHKVFPVLLFGIYLKKQYLIYGCKQVCLRAIFWACFLFCGGSPFNKKSVTWEFWESFFFSSLKD